MWARYPCKSFRPNKEGAVGVHRTEGDRNILNRTYRGSLEIRAPLLKAAFAHEHQKLTSSPTKELFFLRRCDDNKGAMWYLTEPVVWCGSGVGRAAPRGSRLRPGRRAGGQPLVSHPAASALWKHSLTRHIPTWAHGVTRRDTYRPKVLRNAHSKVLTTFLEMRERVLY